MKHSKIVPSLIEHPAESMDIEKYQFWFDALRSNNEDTVLATLNQSDKEETDRLLNGWFKCDDDEKLHKIFTEARSSNFSITRPFILAGVSGSYDTLACLLQQGADPHCREEGDHNLLHSMVLISHCFPQQEEDQARWYGRCSKILGNERMALLLRGENSDGLRPLELAAKLGSCKMVKVILETPGVYLTKEKTRGMVHYQWIDVTEYETTDPELDRRGKSPLGFLAFMNEQTLMKPSTMELFTWPPFQIWLKGKAQSSMVFVIIWFLIHVMMIASYFAVRADTSLLQEQGGISNENWDSNQTGNYTFVFCSSFAFYSLSSTTRTSIFLCLAMYGYCSMFFNFADSIAVRIRKTPLYFCRKFKVEFNLVVSRLLYATNQMFLSLLFAFIGTVNVVKEYMPISPDSQTLLQIFHLICTINIAFSVMVFFQILPFVGIYIIAARRMLRELLNFALLFMFWVTPFSLHFLWFFNTNSKNGCIHEFSNFQASMYSTFRIMLHMLDLASFEVHAPNILHLVHIIYVFVVAILLINFLIAVMSTSAVRTGLVDKIILHLERLNVALSLDFRLGWLCQDLVRRCKAKAMLIQDSKYYLLNIEYK